MKPSNDQIYNSQMFEFNKTLGEISNSYSHLVGERIYDKDMSRDHYMVYDMMDMIIHLNALLNESTNRNIYPSYAVEKLERMKAYVDTTLAYFKEKEQSTKVNMKDDECSQMVDIYLGDE